MWYVGTDTRLWRSTDGGKRWDQTGLMFPDLYNCARLSVDPGDPLRLYLVEMGQGAVSKDGGNEWTPVLMPGGPRAEVLRVDQFVPGRIYAVDGDVLVIAEDEGATWRLGTVNGRLLDIFSHPANSSFVYALAADRDTNVRSDAVG